MNESDRNHLSAWVDDHLEAYVDGELQAEERRRVEAFIRQDEEAALRLMLARRVRETLSAADRPACPPEVTRAVLGVVGSGAHLEARDEANDEVRPTSSAPFRAHARTAARTGFHDRPAVPVDLTARAAQRPHRGLSESFRRRLGPAWTSFLRPSLTTAALVLVVVASALIGRPPHEAAPPAETASAQTATPAEVDEALEEAKWALAYISRVGRRTGQSIRQEVLEERVTEPVQRALETGLGTALGTEPNG